MWVDNFIVYIVRQIRKRCDNKIINIHMEIEIMSRIIIIPNPAAYFLILDNIKQKVLSLIIIFGLIVLI